MTTRKTSDFYWACHNGDVNTVKELLPNLTSNDINRIESNGSTALHAASYYGHADIVRLLIERGANTTIRNIYDKTAKEEASTDQVRSAFESTIKKQATNYDENNIPKSEFIQLYPNVEGIDKPMLVTTILKARLSTHYTQPYMASIASKADHMEKEFRSVCENEKDNISFELGKSYLEEYQMFESFHHLVILYTSSTPFYKVIDNDEALLVDMYKFLLRTEQFAFQGRTYRGFHLHSTDLEPYRWALAHPKSLIEIRGQTSTCCVREHALHQIKINVDERRRVLFQFDFPQSCFTTLRVQGFREYTTEILIISGSFFEVTHIQEDTKGLTIILLKNVPADKNTLLDIA